MVNDMGEKDSELKEKIITWRALIRSSLEWDADMQIRALANNKGVAGKPTTTTANCLQFLNIC